MNDELFDEFIALIADKQMRSSRMYTLDGFGLSKDRTSFNIILRMNDIYLVHTDYHSKDVDMIGKIFHPPLFKQLQKIPEDIPFFSYEQEKNLATVLEMSNL